MISSVSAVTIKLHYQGNNLCRVVKKPVLMTMQQIACIVKQCPVSNTAIYRAVIEFFLLIYDHLLVPGRC